ncbi:MAG: hypothetical protein LBS81_02290 [Endomicrobium sp.]|nr:hypothetical protein [Endomicrobium sp.]
MSGGGNKEKLSERSLGIYDKYLFGLVFETLAQTDSNKFIYVLTTTNHQIIRLILSRVIIKLPLEIPNSLKDQTSNINNLKKKICGVSICKRNVRAVY